MPIHPTAIIHKTAQIDEEAEIGPYTEVGEKAVIGAGSVLMNGAIVGPHTIMGKGNTLYHHCVVGGDPQYIGFDPKTASGTKIGDNNTFREFSQIHRSIHAGEQTLIGNNNYFMATSHIGHDCVVHNHVTIGNYAGCAGHCTVHDRVFMSPLVGVHQWTRIGKLAMLGGMSAVPMDVPPFTMLKYQGETYGLNVVGLRRTGVSLEGRISLKNAYRDLFRSNRPLRQAIEWIRETWKPEAITPEVEHLLDFCAATSKR